MRRLIIAAAKGGTGKTTLAVNLAAGMALGGSRVLLVDLDPFGGATSALGLALEDGTLADVILRGAAPLSAARETPVSGLSVLPAGAKLGDAARSLSGAPRTLREAFSRLRGPDVLIFDTPPAVGPLSVAALGVGGEIIVPVGASFADARTLPDFLNVAAAVRRDLAPDLRLRAIVPSRVLRTRLSGDVIETLRKSYPETTRTEIRQSARLAEAFANGQPIQLYAPESIGAEDFNALTRELSRER